jgi:hypothetical protein
VALHFPPSISIEKFVGGYKAASDYTDLADTETNSAENCLYSPSADLEKRRGSLKIYNRALTASGASSTSTEPITGHYFFAKLGSTSTYNVVAAGDSVFNYNSSTANAILTAQSDNSETFWSFIQIQSPTNAGDDIVVMANGVNPISIWNGTGTASYLSAVAASAQVPIGKYLATNKNRVYVANITNTSDVDAPVQVRISGFGTDGAPDPHIMNDSFYCGGSSKLGPITGISALNDQIIIFTKRSTWKFSPGSGNILDTSTLQQIEESYGLLAPFSMINTGSFILGLSERGVFIFDGNNFQHISQKVDVDILEKSNYSRLQFAKASFNRRLNHYILYFPQSESVRNDRALTFDLRLNIWQPPVSQRQVCYFSTFDDSNNVQRPIFGNYEGMLFADDTGDNEGIANGYNGLIDSATSNTITANTANFTTAGDGLRGIPIYVRSGPGEGQLRYIRSNTTAVLTLDAAFTTPLTSGTSAFTLGGINAFWKSKDYDFGGHDIRKMFRHIRVRAREEGNYNLIMHYIIDFKARSRWTERAVSLRGPGFTWGASRWGSDRWGNLPSQETKVSLRATADQSLQGQHMAVRFENSRADEVFRINGFDVELKPIGKS